MHTFIDAHSNWLVSQKPMHYQPKFHWLWQMLTHVTRGSSINRIDTENRLN